MDIEHLQQWIGRTERRADLVTATPVAALSATLDRDDPEPLPGTDLPPLWHWLYFVPLARQSEIGPDGPASADNLLPALRDAFAACVQAGTPIDAEVRLYDRLFLVEDPAAEKEKDFRELLNPDSLIVKRNCKVEEYLASAKPLDSFQFQRIGYFNVDPDTTDGRLVFNRTVALKDSWKKQSN